MTTTYKRLDLEKFGGDIEQETQRLLRGLLYEANTPQYSVPYSSEGTTIYYNIDRNLIFARFQNRGKLVKLINEYYPDLELKEFHVNPIEVTKGDEYIVKVKYKPTGEIVDTAITII